MKMTKTIETTTDKGLSVLGWRGHHRNRSNDENRGNLEYCFDCASSSVQFGRKSQLCREPTSTVSQPLQISQTVCRALWIWKGCEKGLIRRVSKLTFALFLGSLRAAGWGRSSDLCACVKLVRYLSPLFL